MSRTTSPRFVSHLTLSRPMLSGSGVQSALLALPDDIWTHLLQFIPISSALNLALTCRDLQRLADRVIYRSIDVTGFPEKVVDVRPSLDVSAFGDPLPVGDEVSSFGLIENGWTNALRHRILSNTMLKIIARALLARPERASHVRRLALVKTHRNWLAFVQIFKLVQTHLVELELRPTRFADEAWLDTVCALGTQTALSLGDDITLGKLTRLAVPIESAFRPLAIALLGVAKNLRKLEICPVAHSAIHHAKNVASLPAPPDLESISVEEITPDIATELPGLIAGSPTLRHVRLANEAPGRYVSVPGKEEILSALAAHPVLEGLTLDEALIPDWSKGGFDCLRNLEIRIDRERCWSRQIVVSIPVRTRR